MTVTYVPDAGSVFKNFQIITSGGIFNDAACIFKQGVWLNGKLNGSACTVTNYSDATNVVIRTGVYSADKENGAIVEYILPKADWAAFIATPVGGLDSTRNTCVYSAGILQSTSETLPNKKIQGTVTYNVQGKINGFTFVEV